MPGSVLGTLQKPPMFIFTEEHYELGPGMKEEGVARELYSLPNPYTLSILA